MLHRLLILPLLFTLLIACSGGNSGETPATKPASQPAGPRIVSTVPAATLQLLQLDAAETLVGVSSYDKAILPDDKQNLPVVGDYLNLHYETLLSLHPTALIIQLADDRIAPRLREICRDQHIELVNVKLDTIADLSTTVRRLGQISGRPAQAENKIARISLTLSLIRRKTADLPRPNVVYITGEWKPTQIVGKNTFLDEMLVLAGGRNLGVTLNSPYPTVSTEDLLRLAPDVLLLGAPGQPAPNAANDPRLRPWRALDIPAAKNNKIYIVTTPNSQMLSLDIADETLLLARLLHPELQLWDPDESADTAPASAPGTRP